MHNLKIRKTSLQFFATLTHHNSEIIRFISNEAANYMSAFMPLFNNFQITFYNIKEQQLGIKQL